MSDYRWKCKECGKYFTPLNKDGNFSFNCPICGSALTSPANNSQFKTPDQWDKDIES
jgi:rRNA maturation endonuclease Nob1